MIVGILTLELDIPQAYSLKDKRMVLNRVRDRLRQKFNVAVAEVGENDVWNAATVGVVTVSNEQRHANRMLSTVVAYVETLRDCTVADVAMEFL
ncbi:MAG: hypothetical protein BWZ02_03167 [Lentisphaerae bacterium ADurb.BinA184]|nr:MAG: hypothetical protein BWZ02_03167 [Lentisphaerae bacterium ADurb.BinA184]